MCDGSFTSAVAMSRASGAAVSGVGAGSVAVETASGAITGAFEVVGVALRVAPAQEAVRTRSRATKDDRKRISLATVSGDRPGSVRPLSASQTLNSSDPSPTCYHRLVTPSASRQHEEPPHSLHSCPRSGPIRDRGLRVDDEVARFCATRRRRARHRPSDYDAAVSAYGAAHGLALHARARRRRSTVPCARRGLSLRAQFVQQRPGAFGGATRA